MEGSNSRPWQWIQRCGRLLILVGFVVGQSPWGAKSGALSPARLQDPDECGLLESSPDDGFDGSAHRGGGAVAVALRPTQVAVAPGGKVLVFSARLPGGLGQEDLYVSFIRADGSWTLPRNLGPGVNSPAGESRPVFWGDGEALSFSRGEEAYWIDMSVVEGWRRFLSL